MKQFILVLLASFLLVSCGDTMNGQETITLGQAFGVVFGRLSYLIPLVLVTLGSGFAIYKTIKIYQEEQDWRTSYSIVILVALAAFLFALLYAPAEIAANTTVEMFNRGVVIG